MWAWQFSKMQYTADLHGWTRFVSMQNQYNLMQREEEREMFGLLADQRVGSIPYAPLAKGRLARPWGEPSKRSDVDPIGRRFDIEGDKPIVEAVQKVAEARGIPMAHVALAWVLKHPVVTAPIVGRPSRTISPTRLRRSMSNSPMRKSGCSRSRTVHMCLLLSSRPR
jgi:aryl-alcohol dehydrogenase-like predicted oxidoreductase